jgi:hypothetical protein
VEHVSLGATRGRLYAGDNRMALVLPGAHYLPGYPLLWFAREALQQHGWGVLEVWDEIGDDDDRRAWAELRALAALERTADVEQRLLVAKSISSFAAMLPETRNVPAIWLTPVLNFDEVVEALGRRSAPSLIVGGTADDPHWIREAASGVPQAEVLEIPGADHGLQIPRDPARTLEALRRVVEAIGRFVERL